MANVANANEQRMLISESLLYASLLARLVEFCRITGSVTSLLIMLASLHITFDISHLGHPITHTQTHTHTSTPRLPGRK